MENEVEVQQGFHAEEVRDEDIKVTIEEQREVITVTSREGPQMLGTQQVDEQPLNLNVGFTSNDETWQTGILHEDYVYNQKSIYYSWGKHPCCGSICYGGTQRSTSISVKCPTGNAP